jgi:hypothetical protein
MKSLAKASRVNTALEAIQHVNGGLNGVEICFVPPGGTAENGRI